MFELTNKNALPEAVALYEFIQNNYGKKMISAAQESPGDKWHNLEIDFLKQSTGKLPAIKGFDFIHDDYDGVSARAKSWARAGGIVTICWHTGIHGNTYNDSKDELLNFNELTEPGTPLNKLYMQRWEKAAEVLLGLMREGIPVLWRPFHEFDGQWFWWGKGGADVFIKLWRMMYKTFTDDYGLRNLIWVLGYSGEVKPGWYPGDEYVDITGSDNYDATTNSAAFKRLKKITEKPLAFHEVGKIPPIDEFYASDCVWSWFMTWHTKYLIEDNGAENMKKIYDDPRVITLEDLK